MNRSNYGKKSLPNVSVIMVIQGAPVVLQALPLVKVVKAMLVGRVLGIRRLHSDLRSQLIMKDLTAQEEDLVVTTMFVFPLPRRESTYAKNFRPLLLALSICQCAMMIWLGCPLWYGRKY